MPDEHRSAFVTGDARATVGDRADLHDHFVPRPGPPPFPTRRAAQLGPREVSADDSSCHGTVVTMTPGVNNNLLLSQNTL